MTLVIVTVPPTLLTVNVPPAPTYTALAPLGGSDRPTAANEAAKTVAGTVTERVVVVVVTPFVVVVELVVVTAGPEPPINMAVMALTAGGGVVVDPATVVPLG